MVECEIYGSEGTNSFALVKIGTNGVQVKPGFGAEMGAVLQFSAYTGGSSGNNKGWWNSVWSDQLHYVVTTCWLLFIHSKPSCYILLAYRVIGIFFFE